MHRNLFHFYTLTMKNQKEIKETILFTIATKRIKYLGISLSKETKDLYVENYKMLVKGTKDDTANGEVYTMFLDWKNEYYENNSKYYPKQSTDSVQSLSNYQ